MKPKMIGKIAVDLAMTVLLLLLMAKQLTGDVAHEWLGAGMFVLWIAHHALNFGWHRSLFRGKYMPVRAMQTVINLLLLADMLGTMVSAVILSRAVFAFLPISGGIALARPMHIFCSFWSFVLMALHLGLHWKMVLGMVRWVTGPVFSYSVCASAAFCRHPFPAGGGRIPPRCCGGHCASAARRLPFMDSTPS